MDQEMQNFLQSIDNAFGNDIWNYVILNPCSWSYDSNSLNERKSLGITEESFVSDWNWQIRENFQIDFELPGIFIDSFSQEPWNLHDDFQQNIFRKETEKLWNFMQKNSDPFNFQRNIANDDMMDFMLNF